MKKIKWFITIVILIVSHSAYSLSNKRMPLSADSTVITYYYTYGGTNLMPYLIFTDIYSGSSSERLLYSYPGDYATGTAAFIDSLKTCRYLSSPIGTVRSVDGIYVSGQITEYYPSGKALIKSSQVLEVPVTNPPTMLGYPDVRAYATPGANPNPYYTTRMSYDAYDSKGNLTQSTVTGGASSCLIYGNFDQYVIAKVANAKLSEVAYTSFEKNAPGNWAFSGAPVIDATAPMGRQCYLLSSGVISRSALPTAKTYQLSYWQKAGASVSISGATVSQTITGRTLDNWTYVVKYLTTTGTVSISGTGYIDEVRLYPNDALMTTTAYKPLFGVLSVADARGNTMYYEYDGLQRLKYERDLNRNIIKTYDYHAKP